MLEALQLRGVVRRALQPPLGLKLTRRGIVRVNCHCPNDARMSTPLAVPCTMSRFSCVSQQNFGSCLRPVVPKMHLHRLARGPQRRVPAVGAKPCGRQHFCCRSSFLDQAWGTHVNAQVSSHPHKHWCLLTATALGHFAGAGNKYILHQYCPLLCFPILAY